MPSRSVAGPGGGADEMAGSDGPMAAALTGASTASVQRNLTLMQGRGLLREVTGQGRYRVWTAIL